MSYERVTPEMAEFLKSFPQKKRHTADAKHYPFKKNMHCFRCCIEKVHYLIGVPQNPSKPEKDYRKWIVSYDCDVCKSSRYFKYIPPDEKLKYIPAKCLF